MPKVIISGCNGRMGQVMTRMLGERNIEIVAGFDIKMTGFSAYPVYDEPMDYTGEVDVVVDFSSPEALDKLIEFAVAKNIPLVLCTTGYSAEQLETIAAASAKIPVFRSGNMSVGINLISKLLTQAAAVLGGNFDVEIVERHHRTKVDAPSGTAIMLADAVAEGLDYVPEKVFERQSVRRLRGKTEIGISAVRGGTIVGEHEVIFAGTDEVIEFKHIAYSREVFANGAVTALLFMSDIKTPGMYNMNDALENMLNG